MNYTTLKRDGGWCVELITPLKGRNGDVTQLDIQTVEFSQVDRWGKNEIRSTMALLAELCGQPEGLLRLLKYPDVDRVLLALVSVMPPSIRADFEQGKKPLFTPEEFIEEATLDEHIVPDQIDPRFPHVDGPVKRFVDPKRPPEKKPEPEGMDLEPPAPIMKAAV